MSNNDPGVPLADGEKSNTGKSAWQRPVLRRLAANQADAAESANKVEARSNTTQICS
jgi:hypothetical protein